jgi:6-phosphogluconolactonase/glucosamine-6-phosphate isomerase/deaminase
MANRMRVIKLDEWLGASPTEPGSCEYAIRSELIEPAGIPDIAFVGFHTDPHKAEREVSRIDAFLNTADPIDLAILGLGANGHIGFNEPGDRLIAESHITALSEDSRRHPMAARQEKPPLQGITLGMRAILCAGTILLIVTGEEKRTQLKRLMEEDVTTWFPASFLQLHRRVICLADEAAVATTQYAERRRA